MLPTSRNFWTRPFIPNPTPGFRVYNGWGGQPTHPFMGRGFPQKLNEHVHPEVPTSILSLDGSTPPKEPVQHFVHLLLQLSCHKLLEGPGATSKKNHLFCFLFREDIVSALS